jgi:hypothetical protein
MIANIDGPVWLPSLPPSFEQFLAPNLQPVPILPAVALLVAVAYLMGAIRLWTHWRRWSVLRTFCFLLGSVLLLVVTGAGVEGYGFTLFSVFMFQQLTLMMIIPPLLVSGSPGTLLLRAPPHRGHPTVTRRVPSFDDDRTPQFFSRTHRLTPRRRRAVDRNDLWSSPCDDVSTLDTGGLTIPFAG